MVSSGLDVLLSDHDLQKRINGTVGYLCHAASVDQNLDHGLQTLRTVFGKRLMAAFSPQHGLYGSDQDNMIETRHGDHPFFGIRICSLYSETRTPTDEMLREIDHMIIDLQDVGSRIYTYIYTMLLTMEACGRNGIKVWILDRPNPVGGEVVEGNMLDMSFRSFVGLYPLPMRHGLTIGEIAIMGMRFWNIECEAEVVRMRGWHRRMYFEDTGLPWVQPSPNMPHADTAILYPGTVLIEGTNLSEGRGTTRSLELVGHPAIEPFALTQAIEKTLASSGLTGFKLRPLFFKPVAQKHMEVDCGGWQIHITERRALRAWSLVQILLRELYAAMGDAFEWKLPPYEYEYQKMPIDILNGTDILRQWIEQNGSADELEAIAADGLGAYLDQKSSVHLYA
jgi:uncharacterized protein YbbC (DUF1343 family)